MLKLTSKAIVVLMIFLISGCASIRSPFVASHPTHAIDDKQISAKQISADKMAEEIRSLAKHIAQRQKSLLDVPENRSKRDKDGSKENFVTGLRGVKLHLDKATRSAEGIEGDDFNKTLLIDDIKSINVEIERFLQDSKYGRK